MSASEQALGSCGSNGAVTTFRVGCCGFPNYQQRYEKYVCMYGTWHPTGNRWCGSIFKRCEG